MWKLFIFAVAIFFLYKMITNERRRAVKYKKKQQRNLIATGEMTKDPTCGSFVSVDSDIRARNGNKVLYFCSYDCRDKYLRQIGIHKVHSKEPTNS